MSSFPFLSVLTFIPVAGALLVALLPAGRARLLKSAGLVFSFASLALMIFLAAQPHPTDGGIQWKQQFEWMPFDVYYHVGADGLSLLLLLLSAIVTAFALMALDVKAGHTKVYVSLILLLETTLFGTFTALNFIHWFIYYQLSLVPVFFLIRINSGARATRAAYQFFIYTFFGGLTMLLGFLAIHQATGSFDLIRLAELGRSGELSKNLVAAFGWIGLRPGTVVLLVFCAVFFGLAVKVPVVPFHTWLPDAYCEAPTPVSMLLTSVLSQVGVYGFLRLLMPLFPELMGRLQWPLLALALITILFSALAALGQTDLKRIIAYSSINHLGYCLLGIFAVTASLAGAANDKAATLDGVILQMFNYGITAAALFFFVGLIEVRTGGLRGLSDFGGIRAVAPVLCGLMGISIFSSLGLPGLNGFVGEFLIFKGTFALVPWAAAAVVAGPLITAVFLLTIIQRVFSGPLNPRWSLLPDLTLGERLTVAPIVGLMFVLGIYPEFLISLFNQTVLHLLP